MIETIDPNKSQTEAQYERTADQDLELWKHHASFGGEDKNRMVTIASWLLGASAAILWYIVNSPIFPDGFGLGGALRSLGIATLGMGVSVVAGYVSLLYGGYANRNWEKADQIARSRGWKDLLPLNQKTSSYGLNAIAKRLARPCRPEKELPRIFIVYFVLAALLLAAHFAIFFWALAIIL